MRIAIVASFLLLAAPAFAKDNGPLIKRAERAYGAALNAGTSTRPVTIKLTGTALATYKQIQGEGSDMHIEQLTGRRTPATKALARSTAAVYGINQDGVDAAIVNVEKQKDGTLTASDVLKKGFTSSANGDITWGTGRAK